MKLEYMDRALTFHFAWIIDQMEHRIRDKHYPMIEKRLGEFKETWE